MEIPMTVITCAGCHVQFAISTDSYNQLRGCHNNFYCPNGHGNMFYGQTEAEKLQAQLRQKQSELDLARSDRDFFANEKDRLELKVKRLSRKAKK